MTPRLYCPRDKAVLEHADTRDVLFCPRCGFEVTGVELHRHRGLAVQYMIDSGEIGRRPTPVEETKA